MMQVEKLKVAVDAVEDACGKCPVCSPDCPIAVAKRSLQSLLYDLEAMSAEQ